MLCRTFCHLPGVGRGTEQRLWSGGLHHWQAVAQAEGAVLGALAHKRQWLDEQIQLSQERLAQGDARYFADNLPAQEQWRLFSHFHGNAAYLDIETTGLSPDFDHVTTIALFDGRQVRHYIWGQNLDQFAADVAQYALLVTYNGKCFDVPFLRRNLGVDLPQAHVDLRYVLAALGYRGGLKGCERQLGIARGELADIDGFFAVLLWQEFAQKGDELALQALLAYNVQDVLNLQTLMLLAYEQLLGRTPFAQQVALPVLTPGVNPFQADGPTVSRLLARYTAPRYF